MFHLIHGPLQPDFSATQLRNIVTCGPALLTIVSLEVQIPPPWFRPICTKIDLPYYGSRRRCLTLSLLDHPLPIEPCRSAKVLVNISSQSPPADRLDYCLFLYLSANENSPCLYNFVELNASAVHSRECATSSQSLFALRLP